MSAIPTAPIYWRARCFATRRPSLIMSFPRAASCDTITRGTRFCQTERKIVVALFAKAFQTFTTLLDIGSAGYDGFDAHRSPGRHCDLHEAKFIVGTHEAGIRETHWSDIARFIVHGEPPTDDMPREAPPDRKGAQPRLLRLASSASAALLLVWETPGVLFIWALALILTVAWLPVLYCLAIGLLVTRF
ncbi:MAG: hypothetical protein ACR652_17445 [Methylocystis sp.]|uniref:hypothetical protein n=1 Tax=Methylocystis sp. TaxID=1911079 RepID=UPI003DA2CD78